MTLTAIPDEALSQHVIILGKTRAGKSSTARVMVERLLDQGKPVCIIDPKGDWWGLKSSADGKRAGYRVVIFGGEHADVPLNASSGKEVAELVATGNRPCIIDLGGWRVADRTKFFIDFAYALFRHTRGPRWLVIDEVHNFSPQGKVLSPQAGEMLHWANRLASEGAGKGVTLISMSQRPQKVHKDYVTSHETLVAMRVIHPLDRGQIKDWIDGCPDREKGKEVLETLASMQRGEAWVWSPEIGFGPERIKFPLFKTYDSFAAPTGEETETLKGWASVDLDEVKEKLAVVVEEAKANDPKQLKAEITRLTRELTAAQIEQPAIDPKVIEKAEHRGYELGHQDADSEATSFVKPVIAELGRSIETVGELGKTIMTAFDKMNDCLATLSSFQEAAEFRTSTAPRPALKAARSPAPQPRPIQRVTPAPKPRTDAFSGDITKPLQQIIDAIRWWNVLGISEPAQAQVAFIAGYSHKSGTWSTYLAKCRSLELIDGRGNLSLTSGGMAVVNEPHTPPTSDYLRAEVLSKIDGPLTRILTPLLEVYPNALTQTEAGDCAGYSSSSGTWSTYLAKLRRLNLIEGRGELKAAHWLFP